MVLFAVLRKKRLGTAPSPVPWVGRDTSVAPDPGRFLVFFSVIPIESSAESAY